MGDLVATLGADEPMPRARSSARVEGCEEALSASTRSGRVRGRPARAGLAWETLGFFPPSLGRRYTVRHSGHVGRQAPPLRPIAAHTAEVLANALQVGRAGRFVLRVAVDVGSSLEVGR